MKKILFTFLALFALAAPVKAETEDVLESNGWSAKLGVEDAIILSRDNAEVMRFRLDQWNFGEWQRAGDNGYEAVLRRENKQATSPVKAKVEMVGGHLRLTFSGLDASTQPVQLNVSIDKSLAGGAIELEGTSFPIENDKDNNVKYSVVRNNFTLFSNDSEKKVHVDVAGCKHGLFNDYRPRDLRPFALFIVAQSDVASLNLDLNLSGK